MRRLPTKTLNASSESPIRYLIAALRNIVENFLPDLIFELIEHLPLHPAMLFHPTFNELGIEDLHQSTSVWQPIHCTCDHIALDCRCQVDYESKLQPPQRIAPTVSAVTQVTIVILVSTSHYFFSSIFFSSIYNRDTSTRVTPAGDPWTIGRRLRQSAE